MSAVKSKDTKMEIAFRKALWAKGFRYRKNSPKYFGKPDIVLKKYKTVIFLDSCFWHGCRWHGSMPVSNRQFWENKIARNKKRDKTVNHEYKKKGWVIMRIWEHELKKNHKKVVSRIVVTFNKK